MFLVSKGIVKMFWKTMGKEKTNRKIALWARIKLNGIEKIMSKALIVSNISRENFTLAIDEEQNYF